MEMGKQLVNAARKRREEKENTVLSAHKYQVAGGSGIVDVEVWEPGIGFYDASELSFGRELMDLWHGDDQPKCGSSAFFNNTTSAGRRNPKESWQRKGFLAPP